MQTFSNPEKAEYQKSIACHPARTFIKKVIDINHRGAMTSVAVEFVFGRNDWPAEVVTLTGVSNRCPTDTDDPEMGTMVALYNCLQRAKAYL